jgi:hypothetical protein
MIGLARVLPHMDGFAGPPPRGDDARLSAAHDAGIAEGRMAAEVQHAREIAALVESHRADAERARHVWLKEQAEQLAGAIREGIEASELRISNAIAGILNAFLLSRLPEAARLAMVSEIAKGVRNDMARALNLRGPADFTEVVAQRLQQMGIEVASQDATEGEVEASNGEFTAVAALQHWLTELGHG